MNRLSVLLYPVSQILPCLFVGGGEGGGEGKFNLVISLGYKNVPFPSIFFKLRGRGIPPPLSINLLILANQKTARISISNLSEATNLFDQ